jgi:hypothetical protein
VGRLRSRRRGVGCQRSPSGDVATTDRTTQPVRSGGPLLHRCTTTMWGDPDERRAFGLSHQRNREGGEGPSHSTRALSQCQAESSSTVPRPLRQGLLQRRGSGSHYPGRGSISGDWRWRHTSTCRVRSLTPVRTGQKSSSGQWSAPPVACHRNGAFILRLQAENAWPYTQEFRVPARRAGSALWSLPPLVFC